VHYCLNKSELLEFVDYKISGQDIADRNLKAIIDYSENWQDELCIHTYLLCFILSNKIAHEYACDDIVQTLYRLPESMYIRLQEIDSIFVDYMLRCLRRSSSLSLEEELIDLQISLGEFRYENTNRY
jgi:hypothetical protein